MVLTSGFCTELPRPVLYAILSNWNVLRISTFIYFCGAASWRKRLGARLPPLGSRVRVSVPPCGFRGGRNGVSPVFPYHKFHSIISPPSSHPFRFISSALVMVRQAWSAGTLATHGPIIWGLHRISSLDPTLCWTRVEDIYLFIFADMGDNRVVKRVS